jgi:hypothetical protein
MRALTVFITVLSGVAAGLLGATTALLLGGS